MSASIHRVYDPAECAPSAVPLDWERCRTCGGTRRTTSDTRGGEGAPPEWAAEFKCEPCGGHGSLKAAALAQLMVEQRPEDSCSGDPDKGTCTCLTLRCESCGHPMSEGTWEYWLDGYDAETMLDGILCFLRSGNEPKGGPTHYSPCDEGCRHGGPGRWLNERTGLWVTVTYVPVEGRAGDNRTARNEASWRPVDLRCLGWPHDLRPEKLAVLCLRCLSSRHNYKSPPLSH